MILSANRGGHGYDADRITAVQPPSPAPSISFAWDITAGLPVVLDDGNQYLYGAGLSAMKQGSAWSYYLADGLGSTMAVVDTSGAVQKSYQYDVYGEVTGGSGSLATEFDFAGQQTDPTGLQYLRARYYDPASGVFLSREPLAAIPRWTGNPGAYASGNSVSALDPSGRRTCWGDGPNDCDGDPTLPLGARSYCGPWGCVAGADPSGTPTPGAPGGPPSACTLAPPVNCAASGYESRGVGEWLSFAMAKLTGEYRSTALSLIDIFPLAETCGLALAATTGPGSALGIPACAALDVYIGGLATMESGNAIERSECTGKRKTVAHVANIFNLFAEPSTGAELAAFAIQTIATNGC